MGQARRLPHRQRPDRRLGPVRAHPADDRQHAARPGSRPASESSSDGRVPLSRPGPHHPGRARRARGHDRPQCPQPSPAGLAVAASPDELTGGVCIGSVVEVLGRAIGTVMRLLPLAGITLSHLLLCRRMGTSLALRRARVDLTPTMDGEKNPHPSAVRFLTTSRVRQQTRSQPGHDLKRACEGSRARLRPAPQTHQRQPGPDPGPR